MASILLPPCQVPPSLDKPTPDSIAQPHTPASSPHPMLGQETHVVHQPRGYECFRDGGGFLILQAGMEGHQQSCHCLRGQELHPHTPLHLLHSLPQLTRLLFFLSDSAQVEGGGGLPPTHTPESSFHSAFKRERRKGRANLSHT